VAAKPLPLIDSLCMGQPQQLGPTASTYLSSVQDWVSTQSDPRAQLNTAYSSFVPGPVPSVMQNFGTTLIQNLANTIVGHARNRVVLNPGICGFIAGFPNVAFADPSVTLSERTEQSTQVFATNYLGIPYPHLDAFEGILSQRIGSAAVGNPFWEALERLDEFARLEVGWDGEHAAPIAPDSIGRARALIVRLIESLGDRYDLVPEISPEPNGSILLQWERAGKEIWIFAEPTRFRSQQWDSKEEFLGIARTWQDPQEVSELMDKYLLELMDWITQ